MKLIFDVDAVRPPMTGVGRYAYELAQGYAKRLPAESLRLFAAARWVPELEPRRRGSLAGPGLRRRFAALRVAGSVYRRVMPVLSGLRLRGAEDCVFHGPAFVLPPFGGVSVATIHDLSTFVHPEFHPPERVRHVARGVEHTLRHAAFLITDSDHARQEVIARFAWPAARIATIPLGVGAEYRPRTAAELAPLLCELGLEAGGFALYVGTIEPRKNLGILLDAYESMPLASRQQRPLVLAGYEGWRSEGIHARIEAAQREGWARYLGYVDDALLPALIAAARVFVYPSRYEGFGLPVLEAMASGVPVIAANCSSIPEVTDAAGRLLDPDDVDGWREAITQLLEDDVMHEQMRKAGLAAAARFSWNDTVDQTLACLQRVAKVAGGSA
ncbi:glycosyltransferase family 4 protein [Niveibacterium sp.]|uniref:glycosyltransferase family 4 protein n=1 Tax=Niveibacterium sp. TaxID=2017444 RepID=UPI0035B3594F